MGPETSRTGIMQPQGYPSRRSGTPMLARIYRPSKTAMQSGKGKSRDWRLDFEPASARSIDPLMGWTSSSDMNGQVRLTFETREDAIAYAERHGIAFRLHEPQEPPVIIKAYADNFATHRRQPWTH
ncbi:MAG: ETC complex I subunit [Alphaproteobacteria bacterium]|nr:MAG: ETC complex I subunit [Alphaproteobacteria bacterium]PZO41049.1 MAG: ETC complex I subunit [Alphaproteobacteria bacterium]